MKPVAALTGLLLMIVPLAGAVDRAHSEIEPEFAEFVEPDFPFFTQTVDARKVGKEFPDDNLVPRGVILNLGEGWHRTGRSIR